MSDRAELAREGDLSERHRLRRHWTLRQCGDEGGRDGEVADEEKPKRKKAAAKSNGAGSAKKEKVKAKK